MNPVEQRHDEQYVRSITELGDTRKVITSQAIFTRNKIKLMEKGVKIDSSMFERLVNHKLMPKLDHYLTVEDAVTPAAIRAYAENILRSDRWFSVLRANAANEKRLLRALYEIPLVAPLAFKLTVAAAQRPEVYDHSIRMALVALYLAIKSDAFAANELSSLAAAAMFHDLGVLHVSTELLRPGRRLQQSERHHLYAHPVTAYLVLREFHEYHPTISRMVFEHHERLDGSGYPRGLKGDAISPGGQILMLAELASTVFENGAVARNLEKFSVLLRLNQKKFNRESSNCLLELINDMHISQCQPAGNPALAANTIDESSVDLLAQIFQDWHSTREDCLARQAGSTGSPLLTIIDERIADLQRMLLYAGFDVGNPSATLDLILEYPDAMAELGIIFNETRWQLAEIINEAHRRMQDAGDIDDAAQTLILGWLERSNKKLKASSAQPKTPA